MSSTIAELLVAIKADTTALEKSLGSVNDKVEKSGGFFKNAASSMLGFIGAQVGIESVAGAFDLVKDSVQDFVGVATQSQQVTAQMDAALKSTKGSSGQTAESMEALAEKLSKTTTFSKDTTLAAETLALRFGNIGGTIFPQVIVQSQNLSARMGIDLNSALKIVGKATDDPAKGMALLAKYTGQLPAAVQASIKALEAHGKTSQAQALLLSALAGKFGDAATAAGSTFAGKLDILKNSFEELKIKIGTAIIPILSSLLTNIEPVVTQVGIFVPKLIDFGEAVASNGVLQVGLTGIVGSIGLLVGWLADLVTGIGNANPLAITLGVAMTTVAVAFAAIKIGALIQSFIAFIPVMQAQIFLWWDAAVAVWAANAPLLIWIGIIALVIAAVVLIVTHLGFFKQAWADVVKVLGGVASWLGNFFGNLLGIIGGAADKVIAFVEDWGEKYLALLTWPYRTLLGWIGEWGGNLLGVIGNAITAVVNFIGGVMGAVGDALYKPFGDMFGRIGNFFDDWWKKIQDGITDLVKKLLLALVALYNVLLKPYVDFANWLVGFFISLWIQVSGAIGDFVGKVLGKAGDIQEAFWRGFDNLLGSIGGFFANLWSQVSNGIANIVGRILGKAGDIKDALFKGFGDMLGSMGNYFGNLLGAIGNGIGSVLGKILSFAEQVKNALLKPFNDAVNALGGIFKGLANVAIDGINNFVFVAIDRLINGISGVVDWVTNKLAIGTPLKQWETGNAIPFIKKFHEGGYVDATQFALVGMPGAEEMVVLPKGANVISHSRTQQLLNGVGYNGSGNIGDGGSPFDWLGQQKDKVVAGAQNVLGTIDQWYSKGAGWLVDQAWDLFHLNNLATVPTFGNLGTPFKNDIKSFLGAQMANGPSSGQLTNLTPDQLRALMGSTGGLVPFWLAHITQGFHPKSNPSHGGIDFGVPFHSKLEALLGGTVRSAGYHPWGGEVDLWANYNGSRFLESYVHLDYIPPENFQAGKTISHGQFVGLSGGENPGYPGALHPTGTAFSNGPHLHYNWFRNTPWANDDINPTAFIASLRGAPQMRAEGGWITEPILGVGMHTGQPWSLGENGRELVLNQSQLAALGNGGDVHHHYYVQTQHEKDVAEAIAKEQRWQAMLHG